MNVKEKLHQGSFASLVCKFGLTAWLMLCLLLAILLANPPLAPSYLDKIPGRTGQAVKQAKAQAYMFFTDHISLLPSKE